MSQAETFLMDRANARLVADAPDMAGPPRRVGFWKSLRLVDKTAGAHVVFTLLFCVPILTIPIAIAFFISGFRAARREYRLHRHGRLILGEVLSYGEGIAHGHEQGPEGTVGAETTWVVPFVKFSFPTPDGRVSESWARIESWKSPNFPPQPGQQLAVLYLDEDNYQVL